MSFSNWSPTSGPYTPLMYVRGFPVDTTTLLVVVHIGAMVLTAVAMTLTGTDMVEAYSSVVRWFGFYGPEAITGKVWTLFTYPFVHNIAVEHIWFAIEMLMFFWFGREVERHIGRNAYIWFYALLVVVPALVVGLASAFIPVGSLVGSNIIHFAVFIGFVTIYPNVQFFFGLVAKWLAWGLLAIFTLSSLVQRDWIGLIHLWTTCGGSYFLLRSSGIGGGFSWFESMEHWKEERQQHKEDVRERKILEKRQEEEASVDAILEKISQQGIQSLNPTERELLERASRDLHQKDQQT